VSDLARYLTRTAVLPLAAAYALATVAVVFVVNVVNGLVLLPALAGPHQGPSGFSLAGFAVVHGRLVAWIGPAAQALIFLIVATGAVLAVRVGGRKAPEQECPWCRSPIPLKAAVCRACRRDVTR
jgi:hypothetical protein